MAGIGGAAGSGGPEQQPEPGQLDDPEGNVSPEEQEAYNQFVENGMKLVYQGGQVSEAVLSQLSGKLGDLMQMFGEMPDDVPPLDPANPIDALAATTVGIVLVLESSAGTGGHELNDSVVFHGGVELLEQIAEVAEAAGIHDFQQDDLDNATQRAMLLYGVSSKRIDREGAASELEQFFQTQGAAAEQTAGGEQQQQQGQ